ncbi:MAG: hypothetical protein ACRC80_36070, partial [Waterburya sp.]
PTVTGTTVSWQAVAIPTLTLNTVNFFALNIGSPSDRFVLSSNGAFPQNHTATILPKLITAINDSYYTVEPQNGVTKGYQTAAGIAKNATALQPEVIGDGLYSWDSVASFKITSQIGVPKYIWSGISSTGNPERNFFRSDLTDGLQPVFDDQSYIYAIRNSLDDPNLLPGYLLCPEAYVSVASSERVAISSALNAVAKRKNWYALVDDNPDAVNVQDSVREFNALVNTVGSAGGYYGFYHPYVKVDSDVYIPASAFVAGVAMNRISQEGFKEPPAGIEYPLSGALGLRYSVSTSHQEIYSPRGMNPLISIPNKGLCISGVRTTDVGTPVQFVNSRIVANVLIQSLKTSFDQFIFNALETDNRAIFLGIQNTAIAILQQLYEAGGLIGKTPIEAYKVDTRKNSDRTLAQGIVYLYVEVRLVSTLERLAIKLDLTNGMITVG